MSVTTAKCDAEAASEPRHSDVGWQATEPKQSRTDGRRYGGRYQHIENQDKRSDDDDTEKQNAVEDIVAPPYQTGTAASRTSSEMSFIVTAFVLRCTRFGSRVA